MANVPFLKLGRWATSSLPRFLLVFTALTGGPVVLADWIVAYLDDELSIKFALFTLFIAAIIMPFASLAFWYTVIAPLKFKQTSSNDTKK